MYLWKATILPFTHQGLEKYNNLVTKGLFRSTSHCGESVANHTNKIELKFFKI